MAREKCQCEYQNTCEFYSKFNERQSNVWRAIFNMYCNGHSHHLCEVYVQRKENGIFVPSDIMPSGRPVSFVYKQLP
jgi:hypothetical protein